MAGNRLFDSPVFRFSIRQLLVGTALVALACVAFRNASPMWVAALLGLTLLVLAAAVALALFRQAGQRAWWTGFALFGWLYVLLLVYSWGLDPNTSQSNPLRLHALLTSRLSTSAHERIFNTDQRLKLNVSVPAMGGAPIALDFAYPIENTTGTFVASDYAITGNVDSYSLFVATAAGNTVPTPRGPAQTDFINVAHAFWTLLLATLGGWFTLWLHATRPAQRSEVEDGVAAK